MTVLYVVTVEVDPAAAHRWNAWHSDVHVPEVLREPGFVGCRKLRDVQPAPDGWERYVVMFEMTSLEAFRRYDGSEAAKRLRADTVARFGDVTRHHRAVLEETRYWTVSE